VFRNKFTVVKDGITITLVQFSSKQVYDNQKKLIRECEDGKSENSCEDSSERRPLDSRARAKKLKEALDEIVQNI
jgi:hypothetical protein